MVRVTKDPEKRKQELIDSAERLFLKKGYEKTSVSDIVKGINVAQGTFYYHFFSKSDILEAVVEKNISVLMNKLLNIAGIKNVEAAERLNEIINILFRYGTDKDEVQAYMHQESNIFLYDKVGKMITARLIPILTGVIAAGMAEGRFDVSCPTETAEFLVASLVYMLHQADIITANSRRRERMRITIELCMSRVLRVKDYKFELQF